MFWAGSGDVLGRPYVLGGVRLCFGWSQVILLGGAMLSFRQSQVMFWVGPCVVLGGVR